jgi:thiol-disulfide isomerase/thioredoxin
MKRHCPLAALAVLLNIATAQAEPLRPFVSGSAQEIRRAHAGERYILALWSLTCTHCAAELALLGKLRKKNPGLILVLVSTDTPEASEALQAVLRQHGLERTEAWVFADAFTERLRYELDPRWHGELPRNYLHGRDGSVRAVSGRLGAGELERWLAAQRTKP